MRLYVSHGAGDVNGAVDWFVVEPSPGPEGAPYAERIASQVESLRRASRTVIELDVQPWRNPDGSLNEYGLQRVRAGLSITSPVGDEEPTRKRVAPPDVSLSLRDRLAVAWYRLRGGSVARRFRNPPPGWFALAGFVVAFVLVVLVSAVLG